MSGKVGGFDLVGMAGVMLGAASCGLPVLLDGFLSYAAALTSLPDVSCNQTVSHSFSPVGRKRGAYSAVAFGAGALSRYGDAFR